MVLRSSDEILKRNMEIIEGNLILLRGFVKRWKEFFRWNGDGVKAGAICFIECLVMSSEELGDELAAYGISIKPAYCFSDDPKRDDIEGYFRVGFGEKRFGECLLMFGKHVESKMVEWKLLKSKIDNN